MSRNRAIARVLTTIAAAAAVAVPFATPASSSAQPARERVATRQAASQPAARGAARTKVTFVVPGCQGCHLRMLQADRRYRDVWSSKAKKVKDGRVSWTVPNDRAKHFVVAISTPWEGLTGYQGMVVSHYQGVHKGSDVAVRTARTKSHGDFCFAGSDTDRYRVRLTVKRVRVWGTRPHKVNGTLAFAATSQAHDRPTQRIFQGVGGAQDVPFCAQA